MTQSKRYDWLNLGLLVLRLGMGAMFIVHGAPKLFDGSERWERLGHSMSNLGIEFWPRFWGFMAAISEFGGGVLMILGFLFRPAMALLFITMAVATVDHLAEGDSVGKASHAIEAGTVFLAMFLIGPGKYALRELVRRRLMS
jgi:putative oxidoreductase